jgi:hypothetical protein
MNEPTLRAENEVKAGGTNWQSISVNGQSDGLSGSIFSGQSFRVDATLSVHQELERARLYCLISDSSENSIVHNYVDLDGLQIKQLMAGRYLVQAEIPPLWLMPDAYTLHFKLIGRTRIGKEKRYLSERAILDMNDGSEQSVGKVKAVLIPPIQWSIRPQQGVGETTRATIAGPASVIIQSNSGPEKKGIEVPGA